MDEQLDIFNDKYEYQGTASKKEAHQKGLWHRVFTCLLINPQKKTVLLQKKVPDRYVFDRPDYLDISVGGHYQTGESPEDSARELEEEVGLKASFEELIPLGVRQTAATIAENYIANEFQHIFLYPTEQNLEDYALEEVEVKGLVEVKIQDGIDLLLGKIERIQGNGLFISDGNKIKQRLMITKDDFVPNYLKTDQLFLRLLIAAKRYICKDTPEEIFW